MEKAYAIQDREGKDVCVCLGLPQAQELILSLTEEYIYHAFLREADSCGIDLALWLFRNAPKYGWNQFEYKERKII